MKVICAACGCELTRNEKHDANFCKVCDKWAENKCGDDTCYYCADRPDKPSECLYH